MPAVGLVRRDDFSPGFSGWSILWILLGVILPLLILGLLCWLAWKAWKKHKAEENAKLQQSGLAGQGYRPNDSPFVAQGGGNGAPYPQNEAYPQQPTYPMHGGEKAQTMKSGRTGRW